MQLALIYFLYIAMQLLEIKPMDLLQFLSCCKCKLDATVMYSKRTVRSAQLNNDGVQYPN